MLAPLLPRFVTTKPVFGSLESDFRTKVGCALTLSARVADEISSPHLNPRAAMMCAATANWTLFTDIRCLAFICDAKQHNSVAIFYGKEHLNGRFDETSLVHYFGRRAVCPK